MSVKLLTEHHLERLSLKGSCRGSSEFRLVKMPHCWKSHVAAHLFLHATKIETVSLLRWHGKQQELICPPFLLQGNHLCLGNFELELHACSTETSTKSVNRHTYFKRVFYECRNTEGAAIFVLHVRRQSRPITPRCLITAAVANQTSPLSHSDQHEHLDDCLTFYVGIETREIYFITSSEFNAYQMWVKLVFFYSEKISYFFTSDWYDLYFHCRIE